MKSENAIGLYWRLEKSEVSFELILTDFRIEQRSSGPLGSALLSIPPAFQPDAD
jgi:hypothetical protein